jgi:BioD-like phosphotransacetylase family protein
MGPQMMQTKLSNLSMTAQASSFVLFVGGGTSDASSSLLSPSKFSMSASSDVLTSKILETIEGAKVFVIFCVFDCIKK